MMERLDATRLELLSQIEGLTEDELNWKPNASTWSIAQVVEHITLVEAATSQIIALGRAQEPSFIPVELPLERLMLDRSTKIVALDRLQPLAERKTMEQLKTRLADSRAKTLQTLQSIQDMATLHQTAPPIEHPVFGKLSTEQWMRTLPLHEARHIQQIEERKAERPPNSAE